MSAADSGAPPTLAGQLPDDFLHSDLPCQSCAYNLRGLHAAGRCPECGTPVELSLRAHQLEFSDPQWLRRLEHGARLVIVALLAFALSAIPLTALATWDWRRMHWVFALQAALLLLLLTGAWLVTTPNPALRQLERWYAARRLVRGAVWVALLSVLLSAFSWGTRFDAHTVLLQQLVAGPGGLAGTVLLCSLATYTGRLAARLGEPRLRRRAKLATIVYGACWAIFVVAVGIEVLFPMLLMRLAFPSALAVFLVIPEVLALVAALYILCIPALLTAPFRRYRRSAEANWAAASAATRG